MHDPRALLATAAAGLAVCLLAAPVGAADQLTVVSWGGAYTKSQVEAYHKPFTAQTGVEILSEDYNGGLAQVKAQVESGNVTWDLVDIELSDAELGCSEGLLEPIDVAKLPPAPDGTPATEDFLPGTIHECAIATIIWSTVYAYDDTKFSGAKPSTIADFFDTEKFPGKRGLRKTPKVNLEWALMADGVPTAEVYEALSSDEGVDRAFAVLDKIKADVVWWEAGAQPPQLLADGEVALTSAYNGRLYDAIVNEGKPFVIVWDGQIWDLDLWSVPAGSDGGETALEFIAFSTDTQRLADQANWISYGPARKSSMELVPEKIRPHLPTAPENFQNAIQNDYQWWADNQDEMNERFNNWLAQ
jgi:putative spermidine/putrescine transport system substrate-binding protein